MPLYFLCLAPLSWAYSSVVRLRAWLYRQGILKTRRLPCKVISVGNLTAGGTGKTPMVIYLARRLKEMGYKTAVLTRGYGGAYEGQTVAVSDTKRVLVTPHEAGDESVMLAEGLPGIPVQVGRSRYQAGLVAVRKFGLLDVVILDDGFQHLGLHRDFNILLLDANRPFGNGFTLPLGYLREPKQAAKRADAVVLTRAGTEDGPQNELSALLPGVPVVKAEHSFRTLYRLEDGAELTPYMLAEQPVVSVAGIADPTSFSLILQKLNAKITEAIVYPDHHEYTRDDLTHIEARAKAAGAEIVITTEKDAVKLKRLIPPSFNPPPPRGEEEKVGVRFVVVGIELALTEGAEGFRELLQGRLNTK